MSFLLVAFGQPAWIKGFGILASAFGFALFWRAMLTFPLPRDRFLLSMGWFAAVQAVQLSWMATVDYMGPLILAVYLFLILAMGAQFGILAFFFKEPMHVLQALAIAGCWAIFEWLRLFFLCGFTWNPTGLALTDSPYSLQFASVWGIFGLSFWVILVNLAALSALMKRSAKRIALWASLALFPYLFGFIHQTWIERRIPISDNLHVALIQTGLFPEQKDFDSRFPEKYIHPLVQWERIFDVLDRTKPVDLILFPEAALPLGAHVAGYDLNSVRKYFNEEDFPPKSIPFALYDRGWKVTNAFFLQSLANHCKSHIIAGLDDADGKGKYNAAFHFKPKNLAYERYEKRILAPIAEYIPLRQWRRFSRFVAEEFGIYGSFDIGKEAKIFNASVPIGVSICLEETFGNMVRDLRQKGAKLFVNLTNDVWFPRSKLPQQHFDHGRVRAVENGVCILRSCNTGVTGAIDCFGRPLEQLPISEEKASALYLSLPIRSYPTLYTWWGDGAILGISLFALLLNFFTGLDSVRSFVVPKKKLP